MSQWLNYHHLFYFTRIVECGSVTAAAVELRVGQPALSMQLKELEVRLGPLFDRRGKTLHLSERGKVIYKYARDIFDRGEELLGVVDRGELSSSRDLILGAQAGVPKAIISETILRLHRKTKAKIRVLEGSTPYLLDQLLEGKADLVLFDHELTHTAGSITYLEVGEERIAFWGTKEFAHLKDNFPHSLSKAPMVLSSTGHPLRQSVESFFVMNNLSLNIVSEAPDTALIKELGRSGLGIVALGERTVRAWMRAGALHKIGNLKLSQRYLLGVPKRMLKDPLSEVIFKEFRKDQ